MKTTPPQAIPPSGKNYNRPGSLYTPQSTKRVSLIATNQGPRSERRRTASDFPSKVGEEKASLSIWDKLWGGAGPVIEEEVPMLGEGVSVKRYSGVDPDFLAEYQRRHGNFSDSDSEDDEQFSSPSFRSQSRRRRDEEREGEFVGNVKTRTPLEKVNATVSGMECIGRWIRFFCCLPVRAPMVAAEKTRRGAAKVAGATHDVLKTTGKVVGGAPGAFAEEYKKERGKNQQNPFGG